MDRRYDPEAAYAAAREKSFEPLSEWLDLPTEMRIAFIEVYSAGAKHGIARTEAAFLGGDGTRRTVEAVR